MKLPSNLTIEQVTDAVERSMTGTDNPGFCMSCGIEQDGVEPDARHYHCDSCQSDMVFGAEEVLLLTGL